MLLYISAPAMLLNPVSLRTVSSQFRLLLSFSKSINNRHQHSASFALKWINRSNSPVYSKTSTFENTEARQ